MEQIDVWKQQLARKASRMIVGGFRPPGDPAVSWFGRVTLYEPGETWPRCGDRLMWPLLQIVVRELPFRPPALDDVALIRVFVDPEFHEADTDSGEGWAVRGAATLAGLERLSEPAHGSMIKPFSGHWELIEADYPTHDDLPEDIPHPLRESYYDLDFDNQNGTKVGGWPSNVQSEIFWAPWNKHPYKPEYVFQIDSKEKAGWMWGDNGVGYFGRGTGDHRDKWAMAWQCY